MQGHLVQQLGQLIGSGQIPSGTVIQTDDVLREFGVSKSVAREALRALEAKGMVSSRPSIGMEVHPLREWNLLNPDVVTWRSSGPDGDEQMIKLLELRSAVEPLAARLSAQRAGVEIGEMLGGAYEAMKQAAGDRDFAAFTTADIAFHDALLRGSDNLFVEQLGGVIFATLRARAELFERKEEIDGVAVALHGEIADAVQRRDPVTAERAAQELMASSEEEIRAVINMTGPGKQP
jgi:DNA-binding FadR family transcriptional regulator